MSIWFRDVLARGRRTPTSSPAAPSPRVDRVLDSLRAPASPRELAREDHAVAEFHRARLVAPPPARSNEMSPRGAHAGLKAALASAAAVALLSTGAAFAASGHAPWAQTPTSGAAASSHRATPTHPTPSHSADDESDGPSEGAGDGPDTHAWWGLCRAYQAGGKADHGHALESSAFVALAEAAGGADQVEDFCATVSKPGAQVSHPPARTRLTRARRATRRSRPYRRRRPHRVTRLRRRPTRPHPPTRTRRATRTPRATRPRRAAIPRRAVTPELTGRGSDDCPARWGGSGSQTSGSRAVIASCRCRVR